MAKVPQSCIAVDKLIELPGWFRAEKKWDLVIVHEKELLAALEFKSQIGPSFGNNFNNRTEEALGSATDIWAAYREGAFRPSARPFLGISCCWRTARHFALARQSGRTALPGIPRISQCVLPRPLRRSY